MAIWHISLVISVRFFLTCSIFTYFLKIFKMLCFSFESVYYYFIYSVFISLLSSHHAKCERIRINGVSKIFFKEAFSLGNDITYSIFYFIFKDFSYVFNTSEVGGRGRRRRDSQADSVLSVEPEVGSTPGRWDHDLSQKSRVEGLTDWATQAPFYHFIVSLKHLTQFIHPLSLLTRLTLRISSLFHKPLICPYWCYSK